MVGGVGALDPGQAGLPVAAHPLPPVGQRQLHVFLGNLLGLNVMGTVML